MKQTAKDVLETKTLAYWTGVSLRKKRFYEMDSKKMKRSKSKSCVIDQHSSLLD